MAKRRPKLEDVEAAVEDVLVEGDASASPSVETPAGDDSEAAPYRVAPGANICTLGGLKVSGSPIVFSDLSRSKEEAMVRAAQLVNKGTLVNN